MAKKYLGWLCLVIILLLSVWIRLEGAAGLPEGQFTETDAYLYARQAAIVSEQGHLPTRDLRRWVPLGRDTRQSLNLYPVVLGYVHRLLSFLFPEVSVYTVVVYAPVFCFCLSLLVLCVFLVRTHSWGVCLSVGLILATLPGTIERSAAGFGDRDAFCLLLGISAVGSYLISKDPEKPRDARLLWTLLSGFVVFLGGLSWEGFGVFVSVIVCVEVYRYLRAETEAGDLGYYVLWVGAFVPSLYLASAAYRFGEGWATHLFAFVLVPPVALLAVRLLRYWLLSKSPWVETLSRYPRQVSLLLLCGCLTLAVVYVVGIRDTFSQTTVVFGDSVLLQSVGELVAPHYGYWPYRYGSVFLMGSLGLCLMPVLRFGRPGCRLALSVGVFCVLVFFRQPLDVLWGVAMGNALFLIAVFASVFEIGRLAFKSHPTETTGRDTQALINVAMLCWAVFWLALSRSAKRYDFFIGVPLAYFTAMLIEQVAGRLIAALRDPQWTTAAFHAKLARLQLSTVSTLTVLLLSAALLWGPQGGGHLFRAHASATHLRHATPGTGALLDAYTWMKAHLSERAVVAAEWSYGTQLNVLAGVRAITDPDHYIPYWIHLYRQHVQLAKNEQEALDFLFTHDVTHLMITEKQHENTLLRSGGLSGVFVPVYPEENFETAVVKVWELHYPAGIEKRPEYLSTAPEKNAHDSQPHHRH